MDPSAKATHLERVAQEAINNEIKHGKANEVLIHLSGDSAGAKLTVTDNGAGFTKSPAENPGMGLQIMKHRAGLIGASVEILPPNGLGTMLICSFNPGT